MRTPTYQSQNRATRFASNTLLIIVLLLVFAGPSFSEASTGPAALAQMPESATGNPQEAEGTLADEPSVLDKLIDSRRIVEPLEQGEETVKVIVNLVEPEVLNRAATLSTQSLLARHQYQVALAQGSVLATLAPEDFRVRHIFENQASFSGEVTAQGLAQLLSDPMVESIEPDYLLERHTAQGIPLMNAAAPRQSYNGQGVAIAIIDDGFDYTHPKLGGGGFPNGKVIDGKDLGENDDDPAPGNGDLNPHGTSVAGIAAGNIGNTGDYVGGVAHGAKLYALKVSDAKGDLYASTAALAVDWCVSNRNKHPQYPILVIAISSGSGRFYDRAEADRVSGSYTQAVNNAVAAGITVVASSGNEGYCDSMQRPAALTNVISVGSVYDADFPEWRPCVPIDFCGPKYPDASCPSGYYTIEDPQPDLVPFYSSTASFLDILAPADVAHTLDVAGPQGYSSGDYCDFGGTSAACPYAAGAVACLQSASKAITGDYLTPSEVRDILASTGDNVTDSKAGITTPRINLGRAIGRLSTRDRLVLTFEGITTEEIAHISDGYGDLSWSASFAAYRPPAGENNGYVNGMISPDYVAFNGSGNPVEVSGDPFDFVGAYLTAAWEDSLGITIQGYRSGSWVYSRTVTVNNQSPTWIELGYEDVERVAFTPARQTGLGFQFVMDDMVIERSPIPANAVEYASTDTPKDIMDGMSAFSRLVIRDTGTIADIDVKLDITHSYDQDLSVYLRPPPGFGVRRILLFSGIGGAGDNFRGTILDDEASRSLSQGSAPFVGSYRPAQQLSTLYGGSLTGTWTLEIVDQVGWDEGMLDSWSLIIEK